MPLIQGCADLLREQAYKTLTPQIQALEDELQAVVKLFADKIRGIGYKLEALRHTELPAAELILDEYLRDYLRKRDIESDMLALFSSELRTKETQEEILSSLLDSAANCFPYLALFTIRGNMLKGWSSRGFSDYASRHISSDEFSQTDFSSLPEVISKREQTELADLPDTGSLRLMRSESSGSWQIYPLFVLDRPVAILIAGETDGTAGRPKALAVLMDFAALRLENVALKIIKTLNESARVRVAAAAPATEAPAGNPQDTRIDEPLHTESIPTLIAKPEGFTEELKQSPNQQEEKLYAAAKRFAALLVSEIRLSNEDAILEGREHRDLYLRLKRDMDHSREMYERRVAPTVSCRIDYLHDEFVRILGNGDSEALGDAYPGQRIRKQTGL